MGRMRDVWTVAAEVAALMLLVGCGSEDEKADVKSPPPPAVQTSVDPYPSETETGSPDTPAGHLDKLADEKGWFVDDAGSLPSAYVMRICRAMTRVHEEGEKPARWLVDEEMPDPSPHEILKAGMPKLCSKWPKAALSALKGDLPPTEDEVEAEKRQSEYSGGTYKVSSKPDDGEGDLPLIPPGTYRTTDTVEDCYWERTSRSGDIIDNFARSAQEITVTIAPSDGQFTTEGCGTWKKVQ
ncbi:hypothetical protein ABZ208_34195 [Streptomyces sp. NPDC006208]|uniref:hypothetical protein n=1 Tax=Streptomyces sp. NPDC006208 TaxID=3156734 RepID=UPI0033A5E04D